MDSYKVEWKKTAEKDIRKIDRRFIPRIINAIQSLASYPFPPQHRKLHSSPNSYRIRITRCRD